MFCTKCGAKNADQSNFCTSCGARLSSSSNEQVSSKQELNLASSNTELYAGFWKRFAAAILDSALLMLVLIVMVGVSPEGSDKPLSLAGFLLVWLYFAFMERSPKQATLGKMVLGIKVVDLQGNRISFWRATGRFFGKYISNFTVGIGYVMVAFTNRKQALHDMIASCLVVNKAVIPSDLQQASPTTGMSTGVIVGLVIVVSLFVMMIIGIFAAIFTPAYQDYTVRVKVSKSLSLGIEYKQKVVDYVSQYNRWPSSNADIGIAQQVDTTNVANVSIGKNGVVVITYANDPKLNGKSVILIPSINGDSILWECRGIDIENKFLPPACRK